MRNKGGAHIKELNAFTIIEAMLVMALLSILIVFFFGTINRFGEQTKNELLMKGELNDWFAFRANLFSEFDQVDSISVAKDETTIYTDDRVILYLNKENLLVRVENGVEKNLNILVNEIKGKSNSVVFSIDWKGEEMNLSFTGRSDLKGKINAYFKKEEWRKN